MPQVPRPAREVRAVYDEETITVYQAYSPRIADPAVRAGTFVSPFKRDRMTWIKPSFLWMMYRCGWATKPGQERVLAIRITRDGFETALAQSCLSHFDSDLYGDHATWLARKETSPVRIQWDPERDENLQPLPWRSLQVGLSGFVVSRYVEDWIVALEDITPHVDELRERANADLALLPHETTYPLPADVAAAIGAHQE